MSFQAVTWAIEQKAGSPSAKATLWSIANYANELWCAWPSQKTICEESEQSPDAIQKRIPELVDRKLIRRVPLRFAGRKTVDFFILAPSPFFRAELGEIEPILPRGCSIDLKRVAANGGNDEGPSGVGPRAESNPDVAADGGNEKTAISAAALPQTLPQVAAHVAALERQQEPVMEPSEPIERENARAREQKRLVVTAFLKRWPSAAVDSRAAIEREWEQLPDHELQAALDGIEPFLAELKKLKRSTIPAGATYLHERKWTGLAAADAPKEQTFVTFRAWSREWWAMVLARADRGEPIAFRVNHAKETGAREMCERADLMPPAEVIAALKSVPGNGDWMTAWRPWFQRRGAELPEWRENVWVFLPGPQPPDPGQPALLAATGPPGEVG